MDIEELVDSVQNRVLISRKSSNYNYEMPNVDEVRIFVLRNLDISKTYLPNATGAFKEHLEKVIGDSERLLNNIDFIHKQLNKQWKLKHYQKKNSMLSWRSSI